MPRGSRKSTGRSPGAARSILAAVVPPPRRRIVVADDDLALRRALAIALDQDGYEVLEAGDGHALLALVLDEARPAAGTPLAAVDLIVTDVCMPGLGGLEALAILRQRASRIPCVVVTAFTSPAIEAQALQLGAAAVLGKPFDVDRLRVTIAGLLRPAEPAAPDR